MKIASEPFRCKIEIIEKAISKQDSHDDDSEDDEDDVKNNDFITIDDNIDIDIDIGKY